MPVVRLIANLFVSIWTAAFNLENVTISARLCSILVMVSMPQNNSSNNLYLYGKVKLGGAARAKVWNLSKAGAGFDVLTKDNINSNKVSKLILHS